MCVRLNLSKILLSLCVCLSFVGQAMASTVMSYHMVSMQTNHTYSSEKVAHDVANPMAIMNSDTTSMANMTDCEESESNSEKCCPAECNCAASGCTNFVALAQMDDGISLTAFNGKIKSTVCNTQSQKFTYLYRPPILS